MRTEKLANTQRKEWVDYVLEKVALPIQSQIHDPRPRHKVYSPKDLHIKGGVGEAEAQ